MNNCAATSAQTASLDGRIFTGVTNSAGGDVGQTTLFTYHQRDDVIWAEYSGGQVVRGYLVGTRQAEKLNFRYAHLSANNETSTGVCESTIELLDDGKMRLHEVWAWESRPGTGTSVVEEVEGRPGT